MTRNQRKLTKAYKKYRKGNIGRKGILSFLKSFMPEMIFRTTRLEGERVSRRGVFSLFR